MKKIYDFLVELFSGVSWNKFIAQGQVAGDPDGAIRIRQLFQQDIYLIAFFILLLATLAGLIYYYFVLNRKGGSGYGFKRKYWFRTLVITFILTGVITAGIGVAYTNKYTLLHPFKYSLALGLVNMFYSLILFFVLSIGFKKFSVANTTPF